MKERRRPQLLRGEDLPPAPAQERSRDKRARLTAAALALFASEGYERTAIEQIAARAEIAAGGFYQHFRSKRQLLLALMDEFLDRLEQLNLSPSPGPDVQLMLQTFLKRAFSVDQHYLGAYRAWREAVNADIDLGKKDAQIRAWTTARVLRAFTLLQRLPGARTGVDLVNLAELTDSLFWNLIAQAATTPRKKLGLWINAAADMVYHSLFVDPAGR